MYGVMVKYFLKKNILVLIKKNSFHNLLVFIRSFVKDLYLFIFLMRFSASFEFQDIRLCGAFDFDAISL